MKIQSRLAKIAALLLIVAGGAWAEVRTDYDHHVDFANFRTYSWGKVDTANSIWDQRVKEAVDGQLAAKGWTQVPSGGDAVVNAFGKTHAEQTLNTFYDGFPGWGWGGVGESTTTVDTSKMGTLVVDIFDASTKSLMWRGSSSETLSPNPEKNTKKLDSDVQKLFEHFPPNSKRK